VSELGKVLCIFQLTFSWAPACVAGNVKAKADAAKTPSFSMFLDMWHSSL
jgi:hypothetical protein